MNLGQVYLTMDKIVSGTYPTMVLLTLHNRSFDGLEHFAKFQFEYQKQHFTACRRYKAKGKKKDTAKKPWY